jgi:hypothetical protein
MIDNTMVFFQNCINLSELLPGSYSELCHDGNQFIQVEVVKVPDIPMEGEDTLPLAFQVINTEPEVSFMSVCSLLGTFHRYLDLLVSPAPQYMSST